MNEWTIHEALPSSLDGWSWLQKTLLQYFVESCGGSMMPNLGPTIPIRDLLGFFVGPLFVSFAIFSWTICLVGVLIFVVPNEYKGSNHPKH